MLALSRVIGYDVVAGALTRTAVRYRSPRFQRMCHTRRGDGGCARDNWLARAVRAHDFLVSDGSRREPNYRAPQWCRSRAPPQGYAPGRAPCRSAPPTTLRESDFVSIRQVNRLPARRGGWAGG